ncbi:MAG: chorismate synthase [Ruminococcaceae bacterium]|nr:chorismate synthase [Oscillospiraceae bacterium]
MSNTFGNRFRFTIWGQSHAPAIGVTMEGLPAGTAIDFDRLQRFMDRRAPGAKGTTPRKEADRPEFVAGLVDGITCGAPVTAIIYNQNVRRGDYDNLRHVPRPGHADYTAWVKYGDSRDHSGGGQFSGRLTAPLCIAGGICLQLLEEKGIAVEAKLIQVGPEKDPEKFMACIEAAAKAGDSVGGIIECCVSGLPAGLGGPMFDGMENRISQAVFGIPGIKGIEFGSGFAGSAQYGSQNNDPFYLEDGKVVTRTNAHGGILGGITSGMPIVFRVACKPTPSIAIRQDSVDLTNNQETKLSIHGRHDPCIALRAIPCVEAAAAVAVYDAILEE